MPTAIVGGSGKPAYISNLTKRPVSLVTSDGRVIDVWELQVQPDAEYLSAWAAHFRQHYCADAEIDDLRSGTGLSRSEYLTQLIFPEMTVAPGPSIRAGDFAELLVSDFVEYLLGFWVPRGKYAEKAVRNESVKGVDILGFRLDSPPTASRTDVLLAFEVKAQLSDGEYTGRLQVAINDSSKDYLRLGMTLNAAKRRLLRANAHERASIVERFQNMSDHPYVYRTGAAAVLSDSAYNEGLLQTLTRVGEHRDPDNLELIVIRGKDLMQLTHALYKRAADEA